jgi:phage antirepressor YoqD-like protein
MILSSNLYNIKEILKTYDIDEKRLSYFLLGTLIQYIYESRS